MHLVTCSYSWQVVKAAGASKPSVQESEQMQLAAVLKKLLRTPVVSLLLRIETQPGLFQQAC